MNIVYVYLQRALSDSWGIVLTETSYFVISRDGTVSSFWRPPSLADLGLLKLASTLLKRLEAVPNFYASVSSSSPSKHHSEFELLVHTSAQTMCRDTHNTGAVNNTIVSCSARWLSDFQLSENVPRTRMRHGQGEYKKLQDSRPEDNASPLQIVQFKNLDISIELIVLIVGH